MQASLQDSDALHAINNRIGGDDDLIISGRWLYRIHNKSPKRKIFFVITEFCIYLFSPGKSENDIQLTNEFNLFDRVNLGYLICLIKLI